MNNSHTENQEGQFHVNDQCIVCDLCFDIAPNTFREASDGSQSVVYQQPKSDQDLREASEAMEHCPMEAILQNEDS